MQRSWGEIELSVLLGLRQALGTRVSPEMWKVRLGVGSSEVFEATTKRWSF